MKDLNLSGRLWGAIVNNFWLKLLSVLFALGFYAFIHSAQNAQRTVAVKLVIEKPPEDLDRKLMTDIPAAVDVTLVGPAQQLESVNDQDLSITLNLRAAEDIPDLRLDPDMIAGLPPRLRVDRVYPSRLKIHFETIVEIEVPVQVARAGEPASGMEVVGKIAIEPEKIIATGIESAVKTIQFARVEPFDVSGLEAGRHQRQLKLDSPPEGVEYDHTMITASLDVRREVLSREYERVTVEVVGYPLAKTKPSAVRVKISGDPKKVDAITAEMIVPRIDLKGSGEDLSQPGSAELPVLVELPDVDVLIWPEKVLVKW